MTTTEFPLTPRNDFVLVEVVRIEKEETKSASGLITNIDPFPEVQGKILAVGSDVKDLVEGQMVKYMEIAGDTILHNGKYYLAMKQDRVMAVIK